MKAKSIVTFVLVLVFIFSMSMSVSAEAAPSVATPGLRLVDLDTPSQGEAPELEIIPEGLTPPSAPQGSSNTPYFVGAGIAILLFIGVAVYCKKHGNKTL